VIVVVGGHSRNIGKTAVMAGIIRNIPEAGWTAIKITQFGHGVCSRDGKSCHCSTDAHTFAVQTESDTSGRTDTSRFLVAGAQKSFWVRTKQGMLFEAMPSLRRIMAASTHTIVESNSILRFLRPDIYLVVLDYSVEDFKESTRRYLDQANAFVIIESNSGQSDWTDVSRKLLEAKPAFRAKRNEWITPEMIQYVRREIER
jgi:hypothetical protein